MGGVADEAHAVVEEFHGEKASKAEIGLEGWKHFHLLLFQSTHRHLPVTVQASLVFEKWMFKVTNDQAKQITLIAAQKDPA